MGKALRPSSSSNLQIRRWIFAHINSALCLEIISTKCLQIICPKTGCRMKMSAVPVVVVHQGNKVWSDFVLNCWRSSITLHGCFLHLKSGCQPLSCHFIRSRHTGLTRLHLDSLICRPVCSLYFYQIRRFNAHRMRLIYAGGTLRRIFQECSHSCGIHARSDIKESI